MSAGMDWTLLARAAALAALGQAAQGARAELVVVQVSTGAALSITCTDTLAFGTVSVPGNNAQAAVTVAASPGATAVVTQGQLAVSGSSGPVSCEVVADEGEAETVAFSLSGGSGPFVPATGASRRC